MFIPIAPTGKAFHLRKGSRVDPILPGELLKDPDNLRVMVKPKLVQFAIVLSASCNNAQGLPIEMAPVSPFKFGPNVTTDSSKWQEVSGAATGGGRPKLFYLPSCAEVGLPRSAAALEMKAHVAADYLDHSFKGAGAARIAGLTAEAVRHLQWALSQFYSRNPREDHDWPSLEDFQLKLVFLEESVSRGGPDMEQQRAEIEVIRRLLAEHREKASA